MKKLNLFKTVFLFFIVVFIDYNGNAQVLISGSSGSPDVSAMLEVNSDSKGLLIPRMTTVNRTTLATTAADGLLVFDTDKQSFYIFGNGKWTDLSMSAELWSRKNSSVFLTNPTNSIGIGTATPSGKFVIKASDSNIDDILFEVQDKDGKPIMQVTSAGVRMYVKNPSKSGKGISGGFAVGKYGSAKGDGEILVVNSGATNVYVDDPSAKGISGGFAVGKYASAKNKGAGNIFVATVDSTRVYTDAAAGISGGFAVGKYASAKGTASNYMYMIPDNYFIGDSSGVEIQKGNGIGKYNTFFGYKTGMKATSGSKNVFLGYQAGFKNETGTNNISVGYRAGYENKIGLRNITIGSEAGSSNKDNSNNIFLGYQAGEYHKGTGVANHANDNIYIGVAAGRGYTDLGDTLGAGNYNVFIGNYAGRNCSTAENNVILGNQAGESIETGIDNVIIGNAAGNSNSGEGNVLIGTAAGNGTLGDKNVLLGYHAGYSGDGDLNVFIGSEAGANETGSNKLFIDNSDTSTPLIYGDFTNDSVKIFSHLNINNKYTFPTVDGTNNQVLKTDGSGNLSWVNQSSGGDNLGNHIATATLDMNNHYINGVRGVTIIDGQWVGIGSSSERIVFDGSGNLVKVYSDLNFSAQRWFNR